MGGKTHRYGEDTISTEPKYSYLEATMAVGPTNEEMAQRLFRLASDHVRQQEHWTVQEKYEKYRANREMVIASFGRGTKTNQTLMLEFIKRVPRAYLYVHPSINNAEFRQRAVEANHSVYLLLTDEQRKEPGLIDTYRRGCCQDGCLPGRGVDTKAYYSVKAFEEVYKLWLSDSRYGNKEYVANLMAYLSRAESANPELRSQYDQIKREALLGCYQLGELLYSKHQKCFAAVMSDVEKYCPELNQTELREYREENRDKIIAEAFEGHGGNEELQKDLLRWPETRDAAIEFVDTQPRHMDKQKHEYAIDQTSVYAEVAKNALVRFNGMSEREAVAMIRNSTYEQIEEQIPVKKIITDAITALGTTLGVKKEYIKDCADKMIDTRVIGMTNTCYNYRVDATIDDLRRSGQRGADQIVDQCAIDAIKSVNQNRMTLGLNSDQHSGLEQITEVDKMDDFIFLQPIFDQLKIGVDEKLIERAYDSIDYSSKHELLNKNKQVDQLVELIESDPRVVAAVLKQMGLSTADLATMIERESDYDMSQFKEPPHIDEQNKDIEDIGENVEVQTPGNRD